MEVFHTVGADLSLLSSMVSVVSSLSDNASQFSITHPTLAKAGVNDEGSDSSDDESIPGLDRCSVFRSHLYDFNMNNAMYAAYILDPANFVTQNNGGTYLLPSLMMTSADLLMKWRGWVVRLLWKSYRQSEPRVIALKNKLGQINAKNCCGAAAVWHIASTVRECMSI